MSKTKKIISVVLTLALVMAMATVAMISASAATTVYFENSEGWANVCAYVWGGALGEEFGTWPGTPCTNVEGNIWTIDIPDDCTHVIFNNDNNGKQTNNLENPGSSMIAKLGAGVEENEFGVIMDVYAWEAYGDVEVTTTAPAETTAAPVETTVAPVETTAAPAEGNGVVVDGKEYDVTVGEEIVYTATLKTPALIEDVQGFVSYDAAKLTVVDCVAPNLGDSAIINTELAGTVYFNASVVKGIDFTTEATLVEIKFAVVDDTYSEIALTIEEMTEKDGDSYFTDSEQKNDAVVVTESLFVQEETTAPTTQATVPTTTVAPTEATTATAEATTATAEATTVVVVPTDVKGTTSTTPNQGGNDTPPTGSTVAIFAVLAVLTMAAGAVVVLRKKING